MPSIEETIRRIVREEVRAALDDWQPQLVPAPESDPRRPTPEQPSRLVRPLTRENWWLSLPARERPEWSTVEYLGVKQAAELLRVTPGTLYSWRSGGTGPVSERHGRLVKYRRADLERWIAAQR